MSEHHPSTILVTRNNFFLSFLPGYRHCAGEGNGHHAPETRSRYVFAVERVIHNGHGGDAEMGSVSGVEVERQNGAPALGEVAANAGANKQVNAGDDGALVSVTSRVFETAVAHAHTRHADQVAGMPSYMSCHVLPSHDEKEQAAVASFPFSSSDPLHAPVSSDPLSSSSTVPVPVSPFPIVDAAPPSSPDVLPVSFPAPRAQRAECACSLPASHDQRPRLRYSLCECRVHGPSCSTRLFWRRQ